MPPQRPGATDLGGPQSFPPTLWTAILQARHQSAPDYRGRLDQLIRAYWKPVYWTLRTRWRRSSEDAKDLTQAFFTDFIEKDKLTHVDPAKGRFRTFLRVVLDNFMRNELEAANAAKRGGGLTIVSLDAFEEAPPIEGESLQPDEVFDRAWAIHMFREAVEELRRELKAQGREEWFAVFERHELDRNPPTCAQIAQDMGVPQHEVENRLKQARTMLAKILRTRVRETMSDDRDIEDELRQLGKALR